MAVARIVIDPGHGGRDRGAEGFRHDLPESVINWQMAHILAEELRLRGATVLVLDTRPGMELRERVRQAERFNADFFISIHNNASRNANARGTEIYFFTPFSHVMALTAARNVSGALNTPNRGARRARFAVTMSPQHISILVEAGFMTNRAEYEQLINPHYQREIARGLAGAIDAVITHTYPGTGRTSS
jgi:N-acetylmuramoyl-L-alanine amidase